MDKYNLTIKQVNIYGACINIGLWVAFPTGIFYDKYGPKLSLLLGLLLLPGSYLVIHFIINSSSNDFNLPYFLLPLLALFLGQGSAILHTTAFSLNINNFNLKDSSLLVSMLALNMSIGPSLFAFFKENISYFNYQNFYICLSLFLATIIIICVFLFKDYSDEKNISDENIIKKNSDYEILLIRRIYSFNILICVSYILNLILNYAGFIYVKRIMVIAIPLMILFQFIYFYFNYKQLYNNQVFNLESEIKIYELNGKYNQSEENNRPIGDQNQKFHDNYKDLGLITIEKSKETNKDKVTNNDRVSIISQVEKGQNINLITLEENFQNNLRNEIVAKIKDDNCYSPEIDKKDSKYLFLFLLFFVLMLGMGSLISNYNNIHFLVDSIYKIEITNQVLQNKTSYKRYIQTEDNINLIFDDLTKNKTKDMNKSIFGYENQNSSKSTENSKEALILNRDQFIKKKIFFYIIVYFTCNGIIRLFSNSILEWLIKKDKMFYHLLLASLLGLISQFLGLLMRKDFLFFVISLCGTCHGLYMTFVPIFVKKFFIHKDFGKIMGFLTSGSALGSLINSNFLFIYFYEKYGLYLNKESNYKICQQSYCFSYSYLLNVIFFSINILISIYFIINRKNIHILK